MKRIIWLPLFGLVAGLTGLAQAAFTEDVRQALQGTASDVQKALATTKLPAQEPISLLPLVGDQDRYVEGLLKNAITAAGLTYAEGKSDPFWDEVLKETAWDTHKADMLDARTLAAFGKLKATRILVYGAVRDFSSDGQKVFIELELHASSVLTKQHLWGGTFAKRFYIAKNLQGYIQLDEKVREVLQQVFTQGAASLKGSTKLQGVHTVAVVPLAGDIDRYATSLAESMLTKTTLMPKNLDLGTVAEARTILRDQPQQADAVMYGAIRDLSRKMVNPGVFSDTDKIRAEIQMKIENAKGEVLWSETLTATELYAKDIPSSEKLFKLVETLKENSLPLLLVIGGLLAFFALRSIIKAATRPR